MIYINQLPESIKRMIGYNATTRTIVRLPFVCVRKPCPLVNLDGLTYFCFVSNPNFIKRNDIHPFMWLNCYRDENSLNCSAPKYLISESDFLDHYNVPTPPETATKYDYTYFTLDGAKGNRYKGMKIFLDILPILHSLGLTGLVIVYNTKDGSCDAKQYMVQHGVKVIGKLSRHDVMSTIKLGRFSLFPNVDDCSPRLITESFVQNRPCMINVNIHGGWKYVERNPKLGITFEPTNPESIKLSIKHLSRLKFNQRKHWMYDYGFAKMTQRLTTLLKRHLPDCRELNGVTHSYFEEYKPIFKSYPKMFL